MLGAGLPGVRNWGRGVDKVESCVGDGWGKRVGVVTGGYTKGAALWLL